MPMSNSEARKRAAEAAVSSEAEADRLPDPAEMMARLFPKRRVRLIVEADLDPVPGWGNDPDDWVRYIQRALDDGVGHYHPTVVLDGVTSPERRPSC